MIHKQYLLTEVIVHLLQTKLWLIVSRKKKIVPNIELAPSPGEDYPNEKDDTKENRK